MAEVAVVKEAEQLLAQIEQEKASKQSTKSDGKIPVEEAEILQVMSPRRQNIETAAQSAEVVPDFVAQSVDIGQSVVDIAQSMQMGQSIEIGQSIEVAEDRASGAATPQKEESKQSELDKEEEADQPTEFEQKAEDDNAEEVEVPKKRISDLVETPLVSRDKLDLVILKDENKQLRQMRYRQSKAERKQLTQGFIDQTMARLSECSGGKFEALYGDQQMKRKPEYNLKYSIGPATELLEQYNKLVDDAQYEINNLHQMIDTKKLDIAKLVKENNKFLAASGSKRSWQQYEKSLAIERVVNDRLLQKLKNSNKIDELIGAGAESLYAQFIEDTSKIEVNVDDLPNDVLKGDKK